MDRLVDRLMDSLTGPMAGRRISPAVMIIPVEQHPPALHVCGYHLSVLEYLCLRGARVSARSLVVALPPCLAVSSELSPDWRTAPKARSVCSGNPAACTGVKKGRLAAPLFATPIVQCIWGGLSSPEWVTYTQSHTFV
ncbi:hypothetical protein Tamer19_00680 [Cupriavidus sp. TA19]|nr:hypothetical protein Tamer19_00680 [Cupriavidus sp. TA19]